MTFKRQAALAQREIVAAPDTPLAVGNLLPGQIPLFRAGTDIRIRLLNTVIQPRNGVI